MPNTISTDWDKVRVRCTVVGCLKAGLVSVQSEPPEIEFDEDLIHWDVIYSAMGRYGFLEGKVAELPRGFVPSDLLRPNSVFWITIGNDGRFRLFRSPEDETPAVLAPETEETRRLQPAPLTSRPRTMK